MSSPECSLITTCQACKGKVDIIPFMQTEPCTMSNLVTIQVPTSDSQESGCRAQSLNGGVSRRKHWVCSKCMFKVGMQLKQIGNALGVSGGAVAKWLSNDGLHSPSREKRPNLEQRRAEIIRLHTVENRGVSYISKRTGTNKSVCRKFLIRAGVYKVGGRSCVRSDAGTRWDWSIEWKCAKRWDGCRHWGRI